MLVPTPCLFPLHRSQGLIPPNKAKALPTSGYISLFGPRNGMFTDLCDLNVCTTERTINSRNVSISAASSPSIISRKSDNVRVVDEPLISLVAIFFTFFIGGAVVTVIGGLVNWTVGDFDSTGISSVCDGSTLFEVTLDGSSLTLAGATAAAL